jgi:Ca2+-binding RTX toxin-like protein
MRRQGILAAVAGLLALPAAADAATVRIVEHNYADVPTKLLRYAAGDGELNRVTLTSAEGRYIVTDAGAPLQAGDGCAQDGPNRATCPLTSIPHAEIDVRDGDDVVSAELPDQQNGRESSDLSVYGGTGRDDLRGGAHLVYLTAGEGADGDKLHATSAFQAFLYGGDGPDELSSTALGNDFSGAAGNDVITGNPDPAGADRASGGSGNDRIETGDGYGLLRGDEGDDTLIAGPNRDEIEGGDGNDTGEGRAGSDNLRGGPGDDTLDGGGGDTLGFNDPPTWPATVNGLFVDTLDGGPGADTLGGGGGEFDRAVYDNRQAPVLLSLDGLRNDGERGENDLIGTDVENLTGGLGDDTLRGSANGGNQLEGGPGNDVIDGGGGYHDAPEGSEGNDTLIALDGGLEGRVGIEGPIKGTGYLFDDAVTCDDSRPSEQGIDTAIIDPTDGGVNSHLATGGCETVFMTEAPQSVPVDQYIVAVPVTCGAAPTPNASCTGTAVIEQYLPSKRGRASKKRTIGKRTFKAKARKKSKLRVKLNSTGRKAAKGKRKISAVRVAYRLKPKRR